MHDAAKVDVQNAVVLRHFEVADPRKRAHPRNVQQRVHTSEPLHAGAEHRLDLGLVAHVTVDRDGLPSRGRGDILFSACDIAKNEPCATRGE